MDRFKLDEFRNKSKAELSAMLNELKAEVHEIREKELTAELKKLKVERSLPGAKVTDGAPYKLVMIENMPLIHEDVTKKRMAVLREAYSKRKLKPVDLRPNKTRSVIMLPG